MANLVGFGDRSWAFRAWGLVSAVIFLFPPAPLSAAPTLYQLRLLGFSFLNSFSLGLAFSGVLYFSSQIIMGHNQMHLVWEPPEKVQKRAGELLKTLAVFGCQLELGGVGLSLYPKLKPARNQCIGLPEDSTSAAELLKGWTWSSIGAGRARGRPLPLFQIQTQKRSGSL